MVNFDKFLASFITEIKKYQPITCYNLPGCIKKALEDQGLKYKDGEIVKSQRRVSAEFKESGYGESEDERIRKRIIQAIKIREKEMNEEWSDEIAWLEKQGEQKPVVIIPKFRVGDEIITENEESLTITRIDEEGYWSNDLFICDFDSECIWDLVEQKPVDKVEPKHEWSEEDEEYNGEDYGIDSLYHAQRILEKTLGEVDGYQTDDGILSHKCAITAVKKLYEQKPAVWSEEDRTMAFTLIRDVDQMSYISKEGKNERIGWLNSLDEKFTSRESTWSEEDDRNFQGIIDEIEANKNQAPDYDLATYNRFLSWLKSIRIRIKGE